MSAKSSLRVLLRAVDRHVTSVAGNQQWRQHVLQQFRDNAALQDAAQQQQMALLAQEYADLISNVAHHQELLLSYNLGVDPDERNKEMVAKTAARVGFQLPQLDQQQQPAAEQGQAAAEQQLQQQAQHQALQPQQPQQQQEVLQQQADAGVGRHQEQQPSGAGGVRRAVAAAAYTDVVDAPTAASQLDSIEAKR